MTNNSMYKALAFLLLVPILSSAQSKTEFQQILERLDRVETENRGLAAEVRALREELAFSRGVPAVTPPSPQEPPSSPAVPDDERLSTAEHRIAEQAQSKVES
ncbi:MAG: hypothetical protein M3Z32_08595, partial [Acidobacteriota bacterium]|nr:hypothetical protein [Acidobacteriota bacterium]